MHLQGTEVRVRLRPCTEHCQASARNPGAVAHSTARSCQPPPQLLLHCCHGPAITAAGHACCSALSASLTSEHRTQFVTHRHAHVLHALPCFA